MVSHRYESIGRDRPHLRNQSRKRTFRRPRHFNGVPIMLEMYRNDVHDHRENAKIEPDPRPSTQASLNKRGESCVLPCLTTARSAAFLHRSVRAVLNTIRPRVAVRKDINRTGPNELSSRGGKTMHERSGGTAHKTSGVRCARMSRIITNLPRGAALPNARDAQCDLGMFFGLVELCKQCKL